MLPSGRNCTDVDDVGEAELTDDDAANDHCAMEIQRSDSVHVCWTTWSINSRNDFEQKISPSPSGQAGQIGRETTQTSQAWMEFD